MVDPTNGIRAPSPPHCFVVIVVIVVVIIVVNVVVVSFNVV